MNVFGERLKELRGKMSLNELSIEINKKYDSNISKSMLSRYETGNADPKMEVVRILADYFNVSADYLIGLGSKEEPLTIAAHHDGDEWTEEELKEIENFKAYVRSRRNKE